MKCIFSSYLPIYFKPSEIVWASRWDTYLAMSDVQIHWFSIVNSVVIAIFLSGKLQLTVYESLKQVVLRTFKYRHFFMWLVSQHILYCIF